VRLVKQRKVGCADVYLRRGWKYAHLEVDLIDCRGQGLETLGLCREVARLVYERIILRSEAWARALRKYPLDVMTVMKELLEFVARGEVIHPDGARDYGVPLYSFESPHIWIATSPIRVSVVAEKRVVETAVAEVEKLLEEKLLEHMLGILGGGSGGGPDPSQG
jgi:hypothetical protein